MQKLLLTSLAAAALSASAQAALYITPGSAVASSNSINSASVLISDATDASYAAPSPVSGGGGTSWWTATNGSTNVTITFDFNTEQTLDTLHLWDYYDHTPTNWSISLYDGAAGTGILLHSENFSITTGPVLDATYHSIGFTSTSGVASAVLTTQNSSSRGGVGLAEVAFGDSTAPVPEPSSTALIGLASLGLILRRKR